MQGAMAHMCAAASVGVSFLKDRVCGRGLEHRGFEFRTALGGEPRDKFRQACLGFAAERRSRFEAWRVETAGTSFGACASGCRASTGTKRFGPPAPAARATHTHLVSACFNNIEQSTMFCKIIQTVKSRLQTPAGRPDSKLEIYSAPSESGRSADVARPGEERACAAAGRLLRAGSEGSHGWPDP